MSKMKNKAFVALTFYQLSPIEFPEREVKRWKYLLNAIGAKGRIYISCEGINAQMSLDGNLLETFRSWLFSDPRFEAIDIKVHSHHEHPFAKLTIKAKKQLVALGKEVDLSDQAKHLSAKKWKKMLEEDDEQTIILDVRNGYEWNVGHFKGAKKLDFNTFKEFPASIKKLKKECDPKKTRVMMYCTGGIRCEFYSPLLKKEGFETIYQLDGGVIKYGLEVGSEHWKGKLFVFDDRLVVPISDAETEKVGNCSHCKAVSESYYNCANMDCNALFINCLKCAETFEGCCSEKCQQAPRKRLSQPSTQPKPFRKLSAEEKAKFPSAKIS